MTTHTTLNNKTSDWMLPDENEQLRINADWMRDDGAMSKFLHNAMMIIEENIEIGNEGDLLIKPELFQELLDDLNGKNIFKGKIITFMTPEKYGNREPLIVAASTKNTTDEGKKLKGRSCGSIAQSSYESDLLEVKIVENKTNTEIQRGYSGKSYIYPIVDIDTPDGKNEKYGLIGIANLNERYLPEAYIELLVNMGRALGRQLGRVIERRKAEAELTETNERLKERTRELEKAVADIKTLLIEREKRIYLQDFLFGTIGHDFKRYMMSIKAQVESIFDNSNIDNKIRKDIDHIIPSINDTLDLINLIDDLGKTNVQVISIHRFLKEYSNKVDLLFITQKRDKNIRITWDITASERIFFDVRQLPRIMNNLLTNAVKYSPDGGEIHVASSVNYDAQPGFVEITVSDQGLGIDKDDLDENIFKTRWRTALAKASEIEGSGLGLSYVKYMANKCDGEIRVESLPGRVNKAGTRFVTTFILRLPIYASQQIMDAEEHVKRRSRVLVIGKKEADNQYSDADFQHIIEDIEQGLGIKEFVNREDVAAALAGIANYGIVVCPGNPVKNKPIINAAKDVKTVAICMDTEDKTVHIIFEDKEECVPTSGFLAAVSVIFDF